MTQHSIPSAGQAFAAVIAIIVWGALGLQAYLTIGKVIDDGGTALGGVWLLVGYFTILTNILVALTMTCVAFGGWPGGQNASDAVLAAVTLYIAIVGVVYHILLSKLYDLSGLWKVADTLLHYVSPALTLLFWLIFAPKGRLRFRDAFYWMLYPLAYCAYALVRGHHTGWYPYPFLNVTELGLERVLMNSAAMSAGVLVIALALIAICRRLSD